MKKLDGILLRITIVFSILAFLFFTLAPLNELRQGKIERAEKLSLLPLTDMNQTEFELVRDFGTPRSLITLKSVVHSILSGIFWGIIIRNK